MTAEYGWPVAWLMMSRVTVIVTPGVKSVAVMPRRAFLVRYIALVTDHDVRLRIYNHGYLSGVLVKRWRRLLPLPGTSVTEEQSVAARLAR